MDRNPLKVSYAPLVVLLLLAGIPFFVGVEMSRNWQLFWGVCVGFVCYRAGMAAQQVADNVRIEILLKVNDALLLNNRLKEETEVSEEAERREEVGT